MAISFAVAVGFLPARAEPPPLDPGITVLVHLDQDSGMDAGVAAARHQGFVVTSRYPRIDVFVANGSTSALGSLRRAEPVAYIEADRPLEYATDTSHIATRGQSVLAGEVRLPDGTRIDGAGVGVAIVDTGIDGTHPDLVDRVVENLRLVCPGQGAIGPDEACSSFPLDDTDTVALGGHGTHVAGIVAGTGAASSGRFHGAAPGARLYGLGAGAALWLTEAVAGLNWVLENHDKVNPPIRVVNNSWGSEPGKDDPNGPYVVAKLQRELIDAGLSVVFSAANNGGDGSVQKTSRECALPKPGNICVANYDDHDTGTREGSVGPSSSRGAMDDAETWPDLSAPGTTITSTCRLTLPVCSAHLGQVTTPPNTYATLGGTSMAAPHVAGIAALLYQVDPLLRPSEVEWVLEETAHKFSFGGPYVADPFHPGGTSSYDKGHGLVDARAAVESVLHPLAVTSPEDAASANNDLLVAGHIGYGDTVEIAVEGRPSVTIASVVHHWAHMFPDLGPGRHSITVTLSSGGRVVASVERAVTLS
jgi:serine protease AprX